MSHFDGCFKLFQGVLPSCTHKGKSRKIKISLNPPYSTSDISKRWTPRGCSVPCNGEIWRRTRKKKIVDIRKDLVKNYIIAKR